MCWFGDGVVRSHLLKAGREERAFDLCQVVSARRHCLCDDVALGVYIKCWGIRASFSGQVWANIRAEFPGCTPLTSHVTLGNVSACSFIRG